MFFAALLHSKTGIVSRGSNHSPFTFDGHGRQCHSHAIVIHTQGGKARSRLDKISISQRHKILLKL